LRRYDVFQMRGTRTRLGHNAVLREEFAMARAAFRIAPKTKIILVCLAVVLAVLLIGWHDPIVQSLHRAVRRAQVRGIMDDRAKVTGVRYEVRGPLTLSQVEVELFRRPLDQNDIGGTFGSTAFERAWIEIRNNYRHGDELYFFTTDKRSWSRLSGCRGYVLIRQDCVVNMIVTFLN
jgi:hypothetical protein